MFSEQQDTADGQRLESIMTEGRRRRVRSRTLWSSASVVVVAIAMLPAIGALRGDGSTSISSDGDGSGVMTTRQDSPSTGPQDTTDAQDAEDATVTDSGGDQSTPSANQEVDTSEQSEVGSGDPTTSSNTSIPSAPTDSTTTTAQPTTTSDTPVSSTVGPTTPTSATTSTTSPTSTSQDIIGVYISEQTRVRLVLPSSPTQAGDTISLRLEVDGPGPNPSHCLIVSFGDGQSWSSPCNATPCSGPPTAGIVVGESLTINHRWGAAGTFTVTATKLLDPGNGGSCPRLGTGVLAHDVVVQPVEGIQNRSVTVSVVRAANAWAGDEGGDPVGGVLVRLFDDVGGDEISSGTSDGDGRVNLTAPNRRVWIDASVESSGDCWFGDSAWLYPDDDSLELRVLQICEQPG